MFRPNLLGSPRPRAARKLDPRIMHAWASRSVGAARFWTVQRRSISAPTSQTSIQAPKPETGTSNTDERISAVTGLAAVGAMEI